MIENIECETVQRIGNKFIIPNYIINLVIDWWEIPGTQDVFYGYEIRETGVKELSEDRKYSIRRNTIKGKMAEICEHLRLNIPIDFKMLLRSDIKGDGGVDVCLNINGINKEIDVKTRDSSPAGTKYGFLISKQLLHKNRFFSVYTIIFDNRYDDPINRETECLVYEYSGILHASELRILRDDNKLVKSKFTKMWEVPEHYFLDRNK